MQNLKNWVSRILKNDNVEEILRKQLEFTESLIETAQAIILVLDLQGNIIRFNQFTEELIGYKLEEVKGKNWIDLFVPKDNSNAVKSIFHRILDNTSYRGYVNPIISKSGQKICIEWYDKALKDKNGNVDGVLAIGYDITENKKTQSRLNQAQKLESVGRLAGGIAHDFNNMLSVILGHCELILLTLKEDNELLGNIKEIQNAAKRSADMTKQLLGYARKQNVLPRTINLNDIVYNMLNMLRRLLGEQIDIIWKPADDLWLIKIDPSQLDQILVNLCVNSKNSFVQTGKIIIETEMKTFDQEYCLTHPDFLQGDFVLLSVSDNGCGMSKKILGKIFEPFFTTKEFGYGTGLGLSTVYGIVKQNNGFINVYSEPNQGTTFNIYFPRWIGGTEYFKDEFNNTNVVGGKETILVVEDERTILKLIETNLQGLGYTVLSVSSPKKAIKTAKEYSDKIDLLITDVIMPEMNGNDLSKEIIKKFPDIKCIFMSGYTSNIIAHQGILDNDISFIQKPFSRAELDGKIRKVLD